MAMTRRTADTIALAAAFVLAPASAPAQQRAPAPPVPAAVPEFFNPTYVDHRSDATCSAARLTLTWRYSAKGLSVTGLVFDGKPAAAAELARIDGFLAGFAGDALARIECGNDGAVIAFVDAKLAGVPAPTVKFSWIGGRATLIGRTRFAPPRGGPATPTPKGRP